MITYKSVQVTPSGEVTDRGPYNALGVCEDQRLVAVYLRHPSSSERRTDVIIGYSLMVVALVLILAFAVSTPSVLAVLLVSIGYLGFNAFIFLALVHDPRTGIDELAKAVPTYYGGDVRVIQSYTELTNNYPRD